MNSQMTIIFLFLPAPWNDNQQSKRLFIVSFLILKHSLRKVKRGIFSLKNEHLTSEFSSFLFYLPLLCIFGAQCDWIACVFHKDDFVIKHKFSSLHITHSPFIHL